MKKKLLTLVILVALFSSLQGFNTTIYSQQKPSDYIILNDSVLPYFKNVVFITWDGTNYKVLEDMIGDGLLPKTEKIDQIGYRQTIRITSHVTGTNPGLACMETGYGPDINMIPYNMFGSGTTKTSIPENLTIAERLKNNFGDDVTTMFVYAWQTAEMDMTYMNQDPMIDPIYDNMKNETDMYFASENLTWVPGDPDALAAALHGFNEDVQLYYSPVMRADYLGGVAVDFLQNVTSERFYLRVHMTEPDQAGHGFGVTDTTTGEYTEEYMQSLVECDIGTGLILDQLEAMGVMDETLVIIGADHGMYDHGHDGGVWPENEDEITTNTFIMSNDSVKHSLGVPNYQRDIAPTILASMGIDTLAVDPAFVRTSQIGVPFWDLDDTTAPRIDEVLYKVADASSAPIDENASINAIFDISMGVFDWCNQLTGVLKVGDLEFLSTSSTYKRVKWGGIDLTSLEGGQITLNFTITDVFGNSVSQLIETQVNVEEAPISLWFSIVGILAVGTATYMKKKQK
ncbi:MAG: sulfatase-like hydrolase/transferase [Candidatus Heimdallarchaeota archaeon]|nr:sulfatase-like hydrolase/transferase [Candidatus Heimdallarchaeota archaeon]